MANLEQVSMCRTCLSFKGNMYPVFGENDSQVAVAGMAVPNFLEVFINNKISSTDSCPNKICGSCLQQIDNFLSFKRNCEEAQSKLNVFLEQHITPQPETDPQKVKLSILSISYILPSVSAEHQYDQPDQSISSNKSTNLQNNEENVSQKCPIQRNQLAMDSISSSRNNALKAYTNPNKKNKSTSNYRRRFNAASTKLCRTITSSQQLLTSPLAKRKKITQIETNIKDLEGDKNKDQVGYKDSNQTDNQNHEKDIYETSEVLATIIVNYETGDDSDILDGNVLSQRQEDVSENTSEELLVPLILTKNNAGDVDEELDERNNIVDIKIEPYEINDSASTVNIAQDAEMAGCETTRSSDLMEKEYETHRSINQNDKGEILYRCENCSKTCRGIDELRRHLLTDHTKEQFCMICNEVIDSDISLHCIEHIPFSTVENADGSNSVRSERLHKCEICNKMFSTSWQLAWHSVIHKKKTDIDPTLLQRKLKPINAEGCGTVTAKKNSSIKTTLLGYKCEICSVMCESQLKLMEHVENAHDKAKPSKCPFCSVKFQLHNEITTHLKKCYLKSRLALVS